MLVIEGDVDYIIFDEFGNVEDTTPMGNPASGKVFYHTIGSGTYHALRIQSDWAVFLEVTNGPFYEQDTKFGAWSPDGDDLPIAHRYIKSL
jgi:cupin fold WbuC family metalloprotein